ncbi:MAG: antibiotic biosynthesis monooxygenase [Butyrivibrio sp.]|nr:antibiotic biosynthesis monooxygenase [Butyrivibrio sp.]
MFKIVARLTVKKERIEEFKKTAEELVRKSSAEDGNVFYSLNQDTQDEQKFAFIECWKDDEAMKIHSASEHFTRIFPILTEIAEGSGPNDFYKEVEF